MTEQIAIHCLKAIICEEVCEECELYGQTGTDHCEADAVRIAIEALEKQIPKKPITYTGTNRADCPVCGNTVRGIKEPFGNYCSKCGQKLDFKGYENGI